jgi:hypothetical protein
MISSTRPASCLQPSASSAATCEKGQTYDPFTKSCKVPPAINIALQCGPAEKIYTAGNGNQYCCKGTVIGHSCCPLGQATTSGTCCSANSKPDATTGKCVSLFDDIRQACGRGYTAMPDRSCCANYLVSADKQTCRAAPPPPPPPPSPGTCNAPGFVVNGMCCPSRAAYDRGQCRAATPPPPPPPPPPACGPGTHPEGKRCVRDPIVCTAGTHLEGRICVPNPIVCAAGTHLEGRRCVANPVVCRPGTHAEGRICKPDEKPKPKPDPKPKPKPESKPKPKPESKPAPKPKQKP